MDKQNVDSGENGFAEETLLQNVAAHEKSTEKIAHDLPTLSTTSYVAYIILAIFAQGVFGLFPGFARYLQVKSEMGAFMILAVSSLVDSVLIGTHLAITIGFKMFKVKRLWMWFIISLANTIPFVFANRLTCSIYVQLIVLTTPFIVAIMSKLVLKEKLPPYTVTAMVLALIGAFLSLFGQLLNEPENLNIKFNDWIGFLLAFVYSLFLGAYFIFVRTLEKGVSNETLVWWNFVCIAFGTIPLTFGLELDDWNVWQEFAIEDYIILCGFAVGVFIIGQFSQMHAIRMLGAPLVGTLLPFRMVTALAFGASPLLEESLSLLNWVGIGVVMVTIGAYMFLQYKHKKKTEELKALRGKIEKMSVNYETVLRNNADL